MAVKELTAPSVKESPKQGASLSEPVQTDLSGISMPEAERKNIGYLLDSDLNLKLPFSSAISVITDLDTDTRRIVRKLNFINEVTEDYKFFLRAEARKFSEELNSANNGRMQISYSELEKVAANVTHTKIRADLHDIFDALPDHERSAILSISKPNNYLHLLKAIGFSLDKRYVGRDLCEQCSLIQEALTLHVYCKMNAAAKLLHAA